MLLNNNVDHDIGGSQKKLSAKDQNNLTIKRKRLVRQEAVTQYDDKKEEPPSDIEPCYDDTEQNKDDGADNIDDRTAKILSLQSESTGSTETVIEAHPSPAGPTTRHRQRPDNLDIGPTSGVVSSKRKTSNSSSNQHIDQHQRKQSSGDSGQYNHVGHSFRRKTSNGERNNNNNGLRTTSLNTGYQGQCGAGGASASGHNSLEVLESDTVWELQHRRLSSVSTNLMRQQQQEQSRVSSTASQDHDRNWTGHVITNVTEHSRRKSSHLRSSSGLNTTMTTVTLPRQDRSQLTLTRSSQGQSRRSQHRYQHHSSHDNPYYQPRSSEKSEYTPGSTLDREIGQPQSKENLIPGHIGAAAAAQGYSEYLGFSSPTHNNNRKQRN